MPRSITCGSTKTSAKLLIAPQGTFADSRAASHWALLRVLLANASAFGVSQRGKNRNRRVHAREEVGHGHADFLQAAAEVIALAGDAHQSAHSLHGVVVARAFTVRFDLAEAGDAAIDELRVERPQ